MDKKELEMQVAQVVKALFDEKAEADIRKNIEAELQKSATAISDLTTALEGKNEEVAELEAQRAEDSEKVKQLESELEAAKTQLEKATTKLAETEKEFEEVKKDRRVELRVTELEEAGVTSSDKDAQLAKVREMSDEEFASYKEELVALRAAVVSELDKVKEEQAKAEEEAKRAEEAKKKAKAKAKADAAASGEDAAEEEDTEEDSEEDSDEDTNSEAASLNLEGDDTDLKTKYEQLGQELAKVWSKDKD